MVRYSFKSQVSFNSNRTLKGSDNFVVVVVWFFNFYTISVHLGFTFHVKILQIRVSRSTVPSHPFCNNEYAILRHCIHGL